MWVWRKFSKLEKILQKQKLFVLIDYRAIIINYNKLFEAYRVKSCIGLIGYDSTLIDYTVVWDNDWFFQESLLYSITRWINWLLLSCLSCSETNKNTLINYLGHLFDYIVLEWFSRCWMNTLINYLDNLIDYFIEIIDYKRL